MNTHYHHKHRSNNRDLCFTWLNFPLPVLVRLLQRNRNWIYAFFQRQIDLFWRIRSNNYWRLRNPQKPVLYKPWRLRKASEVIQSEPKGQKMRTVNDVNPSPRAGKDEMRCPSSTARQEKSGIILLPHLLFSWTDWMTATHTQEGSVLYCIHWLEC